MEAVHMQIHDNAIPSKMHENLSLSHLLPMESDAYQQKENI
jgi:hypothetical protein